MAHRGRASSLLRATDIATAGIAKLSAKKEYQDLDVAIIKATNHDEVVPKEKHVKTILEAVDVGRASADRAYVITELCKRLKGSTEWLVTLKCLMVVLRILQEGSDQVREEFAKQREQTQDLLYLEKFVDRSSLDAQEHAAFCRVFAVYLDERIATYTACGFSVHTESSSTHSVTRAMDVPDILAKLPALQSEMRRLLECTPAGGSNHELVTRAHVAVVSASFKLYRSIFEGIMNLMDRFFELGRVDAQKGLNIYKTATKQTEQLSSIYAALGEKTADMDGMEKLKFPSLEPPPVTLLASMEAYLKDQAPGLEKRAPIADTSRGRGVSDAPSPPQVSPAPAADPFGSPDPFAAAPAAAAPPVTDAFDALTIGASTPSPARAPAPVPAATATPPPASDPDLFGLSNLAEGSTTSSPGLDKSALDNLYDQAQSQQRANVSPFAFEQQPMQPAPGMMAAPGYGMMAPQQQPMQGFGMSPQQQGFGMAPQQQGFGMAPQQQGFGMAPQPQGFGAAPQPQGFGMAPQAQGANPFAAPPPQQGFGFDSSFGSTQQTRSPPMQQQPTQPQSSNPFANGGSLL